MRRFASLAGLSALAAGLTGCSMCHTPYDYAGPVVGPNGCPTTGFNERVGSVSGGQGAPYPTLAAGAATSPAPGGSATAIARGKSTVPRAADETAAAEADGDTATR